MMTTTTTTTSLQTTTLLTPTTPAAVPPTPTPATASTAIKGPSTVQQQQRRHLLHSVESLRGRVHQVLKCVINLHIEFLVLESNVAAILDEVRSLNDDYAEVQRLDRLIETLREYGGPTIYHEWPYPLIFKGTIDEAHVAQILNTIEPRDGQTINNLSRTRSKRYQRLKANKTNGSIIS